MSSLILGRGSVASQKQIFVRTARIFDTGQVFDPEGILCVFQGNKTEVLGQKGCCSARNMFSEVTKIKIPSPEKIRGGIQVILIFHGSTLVTAVLPSLIGTVTGAPVGAFLPRGSEVVSYPAGLRLPCTKTASSLGIFPDKHVFITAFLYKKCSIFYTKCQYPTIPKSANIIRELT